MRPQCRRDYDVPSLIFETRYSPASGALSVGVVYLPGHPDTSANPAPARGFSGCRPLRVAAAALLLRVAIAAAAAAAAEKRLLMRPPPTTVNISHQVSAGEWKF